MSGSQSQLYSTGNESSERLLDNDHPNPDQSPGENGDIGATSGTSYDVGSNLVFGDFNPFSESVLRQRSGRRTPPPGADYQSSNISPSQTPLMSPSSSPRLHVQSSTWYSGSETNSSYYRRSSEVAPQIMLDSLETPEWVDQIRDFIEGQEYSSSFAESANGTGSGSNGGGGDRASGGSTVTAGNANAGPS